MKVVTAAILIDNRRVLLTRRAAGQNLEGYWEFPGGKLEQGETVQQCLERELLEETALEIQAGKIFAESVYHYENGSIKLVALEARLIGGDITLSVHDAYEWVPLKDVCSYELAPADIPIAKSLIEKFAG